MSTLSRTLSGDPCFQEVRRRVVIGTIDSRPIKRRIVTLVITPPSPIVVDGLFVSRALNLVVLDVEIDGRSMLIGAVPGIFFDSTSTLGGRTFSNMVLRAGRSMRVSMQRGRTPERVKIVVRTRARGGVRVRARWTPPPNTLSRISRAQCAISGWTVE